MTTPLKYHPMARVFLGIVPVAFFVSGCGGSPSRCRPTVTRARDAAVVDTTDVHHSSVLEARLTAKGRPVSGRTITFSIHRHNLYAVDYWELFYDEHVAGRAITDGNGVAKLDLKKESLDAYLHDVFAERYSAVFGGDGTYCNSSDEAKFSLAKTQAGDVDYRKGKTPPVAISPSPVAVPQIPIVPVPLPTCSTVQPVGVRVCVPLTNGLDPHLP